MAERTPASDSEKVDEIAPDKTREINAILSAETPAVTVDGDGGKINRRVKRNIITVPERPNEFEKDGTTYRRDRNGRWRPVLH